MEIITDFEALSNRADEIDTRKENALVREIVVKLKETIREHNLAGLSAPQIGYDKRIICINFKGDIRTFVNPIIVNVEGLEMSRETCSSLPGKTFIRPRHNKIAIMSQTPLGKTESRTLIGLAAKVFQHEVDHLDGLLLSDVGLEIDDDFDKATTEEKAEIIKAYLDSLDIRQKGLEQEIQEDKDLKQMSDAINFMTGVQKGEIKLVKHDENTAEE